MDNLSSINLLSNLKAIEVSEDTKFIDLFTCFFSPIMPPETPQFNVDVEMKSFGEKYDTIGTKKSEKIIQDPKKMTLAELENNLKILEIEFKNEFQKLTN